MIQRKRHLVCIPSFYSNNQPSGKPVRGLSANGRRVSSDARRQGVIA